MAKKPTKRQAKIRRLNARIRYANERGAGIEKVGNDIKGVQFRSVESSLRRAARERKEERAKLNLSQRIKAYNERTATPTNQLNFTDKVIKTLKPEKRKELAKALAPVLSAKGPIPKDKREKAKRDLAKVVGKHKGPPVKRSNLSYLSESLENRVRRRMGEMTYAQDRYFNNFLIASMKTGNRTMFERAMKYGPDYVHFLFMQNFEIDDLYPQKKNEDDDTLIFQWLTDDEVNNMLGKQGLDRYNVREYDWKTQKDSAQARGINTFAPKYKPKRK